MVHIILDPRTKSVFVTNCCIINYPHSLVAPHFHYLTVFVVQELSGVAGPLLHVLSKVVITVSVQGSQLRLKYQLGKDLRYGCWQDSVCTRWLA